MPNSSVPAFLDQPKHVRPASGFDWARLAGVTYWLTRGTPAQIADELRLRASVGTSLWPQPGAVLRQDADAFLLARAPHASRVRPDLRGDAALLTARHALAQWRLMLVGRALPDVCYWRREGELALASFVHTKPRPRAEIVNSLRSLLGPAEAAAELLAASLAPLPDVDAQAASLAAVLETSRTAGIAQVLAIPDLEQAQAACSLLMSLALERGISLSSEKAIRADIRLYGPARIATLEKTLARVGEQPVVAVALAGRRECERAFSQVANVHAFAAPRRGAWLEWLREIGIEGALVVEELAPVLERNVEEARRLVLALIGRSGAVLAPEGASIHSRWPEEWHDMLAAAAPFVHPQAARLARLLRSSPAGLSAASVEQNALLAPAARQMLAGGSALREGVALVLAPGVNVAFGSRAQRQSDLRWLAERPQLCPFSARQQVHAWTTALLLNAGELSAWDSETPKRLRTLLDEHGFEAAAQLLEAHALAASRRGAGPPEIEALLIARALGLLLWPPKRLRRLYRMWLRGYRGEWRATLLALLAQVERAIRGPQAYAALIDAALHEAPSASRAGREQAWVECASCLGPDDPARARAILNQLGTRPALDARLHTSARALIAHASAEFVSVRIAEALDLLSQARDALAHRTRDFLGRRVLGEIESLTAMYVSVLSGGERGQDALLEPLRELEHEHGGLADLISRATINDQLFRLRRFESGSFDPREIENLLAEARPENRRGYMVLLNQLCENAVYRMDMAAFARLSARVEAVARAGALDVIVEAAWKRHSALKLALAGEMRAALRLWRHARAYSAPAPWNRRSAFIRHGEWGFMLMLAGRFERAARSFFRATRELRGMEVLGRAAPFCALGCAALMLAGREVPKQEQAAMQELVEGEYAFAWLMQLMLRAARGELPWAEALASVFDHDAVLAWKGVAFTLGAALAKAAAAPDASRFASAARKCLGEAHQALTAWLDALFPLQVAAPEKLGAEVAVALAELRFSPTDPPAPDVLIERAATLLARATGADVLIRLAMPGVRNAAFAGSSNHREELEAFAAALPAEGILCATLAGAPSELAGSVCMKLHRSATAANLAAARAFCGRLDEYVLLAQARDLAPAARRREQMLLRAAWEFARGPRSPGSKLEQLTALVQAQAGAQNVLLALAPTGRPPAPREAPPLRAAVEVEAGLSLSVFAAGGDTAALRRSLELAAQAVAQWMRDPRSAPEFQFLEPGTGDVVRLMGEIVGASEAARELARSVRRFAGLDLTITIVGESGSGKDFAARALHALSRRAHGEHVVVDCATLRRETAASELFGHVRGAFTGATADHIGLLARSHNGTLQLDNVAELQPDLQALLLRALEERRITPVGGQRETAFDARVLVTSQRSLDALVAEKRLRLDFAQRLGGLTLNVPPLRDRQGDASLLAEAFVVAQSAALGRAFRMDAPAREAIESHSWPGNVRELRSSVARACALADGTEIRAADLVAARREGGGPLLALPREKGLKSGARMLLALARSLGVISPREAAAALGISRTTASLTLTALARADLVERTGSGRSTVYRSLH